MPNKKLKYWTSWDQILGVKSKNEKDFWVDVGKALKRNWKMYKQWSSSKLLVTLSEMIKVNNYKHVRTEIVENFVRSFEGTPRKPEGIKLVDTIIHSIKHAKVGKYITVKPKSPKVKKKPKKVITPAMHLLQLKDLNWVERKTKLYDSHVDWTVKEIWQSFFVNQSKKNAQVKAFNKITNLNEIQKDVKKRFNEEYKTVNAIEDNYSDDFTGKVIDNKGKKHKLTMHQKVAGLYASKGGFIDLGNTGVGKTYTATLAVSLRNSMKTLVICPANLIANEQWKNNIESVFPECRVYSQHEILEMPKNRRKIREFYLVSFQTLSRSTGDDILKRMIKEKIDYIVIDEGQRVKVRDETAISKVRAKLQNTLLKIRKKRKLDVLMLTATPAPNTVTEAKSLLELVTGKKFKISGYNSIINLSKMHCALQENAIKYQKRYPVGVRERDIECAVKLRLSPHRKMLVNLGFLGMDQISLVEAKMPEILKRLSKTPKNDKVIIFTKYVTGMVDEISEALERKGITHTYYTGTKKEGLEPSLGAEFFNGKKVLIASSAIAEGLDKIQDACRNIWFVGHGWTYSERQQVIGRVYRTGQKRNVDVLTFMASINGYEYDKNVKIHRINTKKIYHDCIVDGNYPETISETRYNWKKIVNDVIRGEKVKGSRLIEIGLLKKLEKHDRKITKNKKKRKNNKH